RVAQTLGLRPHVAHVALTGLVTLAVVSAFQAVGTLLVVGMLLAPAVAAGPWTRSIPSTMALATVFGAFAVATGLVVSWYAGTAAGATIAGSAIGFAAMSSIAAGITRRLRLARHAHRDVPAFDLLEEPA